MLLNKNLKADGHLHYINVLYLIEKLLHNDFILKEKIAYSAVASFPWGMGLGSVQWTLLTKNTIFRKAYL